MLFDLNVQPEPPAFHGFRSVSPLTVLSGPNNGGKSALLKGLKQHIGRTAYLMGPIRFYHVSQIGSQPRDPAELDNLEYQFQSTVSQSDQNYEQNFLDLNRILIGLSDTKRATLFEICGELIGATFQLRLTDPDNSLSMRYVDVDGQTLGHASTGTRLLMTMLGTCMDERFSVMLIDEPELGLSPRVQRAFAEFLQDDAKRKAVFPHLANVYLATHSHLFLDRRNPGNNFMVTRSENTVTVAQVNTVNELHQLQFNLLGNSLETVFLPAAIVIVEGKTDHTFVRRVLETAFPDRRITVIAASGDPKGKVHSVKETLGGDLQKSPFRSRLFVVLDSVHTAGLPAALAAMGVEASNVIVWDKNGIEYLYPPALLSDIFACSTETVSDMGIEGDLVSIKDVSFKKAELCDEVAKRLTHETPLPEELVSKLLDPLSAAIS